jgi:hypothetical protein
MLVNRETFFEIQSYFESIPFNQTSEWLDSIYDKEDNILFFCDDIKNPTICSWGVVRESLFGGRRLYIEGASIKKEITIQQIKNFYKQIISYNFSLIEVSDINLYDINYEIGIRRAGFVRPLLMSLSPLTMIVDLKKPFEFHRNWRRNVKRSIEQGVEFCVIEHPTLEDIRIFINLFKETKERKRLSWDLHESNLLNLLKSCRYRLFFAKDKGGSIIAGRIIYIFGQNAYDVFAANSNSSLILGATYYLQEEILKYLKYLGIIYFDYGRISPGIDSMDNIYLSKSYSGGRPALYNGQWIYSKSFLLEYIIVFYRYIIKKGKRY